MCTTSTVDFYDRNNKNKGLSGFNSLFSVGFMLPVAVAVLKTRIFIILDLK